MEKTSAALVKRVQNDEEEAFNELFSLLYKRVYYSAYRICKSDDDAKEISQQTFIQVHRSIKNLNDPNTFDVWLHRIIVSKCYNLFAKCKDAVIDPETSAMLKNKEEYRDYLIPKNTSHRLSDIELLNAFIDELPEKYRILLVLAYFQEHSMEEVSAILQMPVGTVKSRLSTARGLLKRKIHEYEKMEGISLDFHEFSPAVIALALASAYQKVNIPIPANLLKLPTSWMHSFFSAHMMVAGAALALSGVLAVGGYGLLHSSSISNQQESRLNYLDNEVIFQPVTIDGITYLTPQDAYYSLLAFAHCEVEMNAMSQTDLYHLKPLYDALKSSNSSYYLQLQRIGWEDYYLKRL